MTLQEYYERLKMDDTPVVLRAGIKSIPKGRPRLGRRGFVFTPERTREFENTIKQLAIKIMGHRLPYSCPVKVTVWIDEVIPKSYSKLQIELAQAGLILPSGGDLDNRFKAVTDAMNTIVYHDDAQVGEEVALKRFGTTSLIVVKVERTGLSDLEIDRYKKMQKVKNGKSSAGGSSTTMG